MLVNHLTATCNKMRNYKIEDWNHFFIRYENLDFVRSHFRPSGEFVLLHLPLNVRLVFMCVTKENVWIIFVDFKSFIKQIIVGLILIGAKKLNWKLYFNYYFALSVNKSKSCKIFDRNQTSKVPWSTWARVYLWKWNQNPRKWLQNFEGSFKWT